MTYKRIRLFKMTEIIVKMNEVSFDKTISVKSKSICFGCTSFNCLPVIKHMFLGLCYFLVLKCQFYRLFSYCIDYRDLAG